MNNYAEIVPLNWSDLAVSELPTGTVTLLLADVEGSTRLWENHCGMAESIAHLNLVVSELVAAHEGVRPLEQGEGDSFVVAFAKASDAVACALALQKAPLDPIKLRIGVHTGEIQLRDESNYAGPTINRAARLRDLAHGGQTVLSGATEGMVIDRLPAGAWLADLGSHALRDLPRPERVMQLNHPDVRTDFPPLHVPAEVRRSRLPVQLTSFVGRADQIDSIGDLLRDNRLVTLTGAGGAGKTRLAIRVAGEAEQDFAGAVYFVDLAPLTNPALVPVAVARALELTDQPGFTTIETIQRFIGDRKVLVVLDNCEHLLDACSEIVMEILQVGTQTSVLATSREPIGIAGELTWRVPSLSIDDEAVALFADRARRTRTDLTLTSEQTAVVTEICRRLDGMPLAIELAAARTRTLSISQILESLRSNFRVLTGGSRTAVRRQQTLSASIDWSYSLLTEPERILLRRIAVFTGGFDLDAAHAVGAQTETERAQLIDVLGLLVDKSLVAANDSGATMRYRLSETVRQYCLEKLAASGEADDIRAQHCAYYCAAASRRAAEMRGDGTPLIPWSEVEMDNLRSAFAWSCENADFATALTLVSALQRFWLTTARYREGLAGFGAAFSDERFRRDDVAPQIWISAVANEAILALWFCVPVSIPLVEEALSAARGVGDDRLTARILHACGLLSFDDAEAAGRYLTEAISLARSARDESGLLESLAYVSFALLHSAGLPDEAQRAGEEGWRLAERLGDRFLSRYCRSFVSNALAVKGQIDEAIAIGKEIIDEARLEGDLAMEALGLTNVAFGWAFIGDPDAAYTTASAALTIECDLAGVQAFNHAVLAYAALGQGDLVAAWRECQTAAGYTDGGLLRNGSFLRTLIPGTQASIGCGDLAAARRWAEDTVSVARGAQRVVALAARARVAIAQGEFAQADRDLHEALASAAGTGGLLSVPDALECLAMLVIDSPERAARLFGAADGIRQRTREVRCPIFDHDHEQAVGRVRDCLEQSTFERLWYEGQALTTDEAIGFAQRGHGERKRPASGWGSLTPTELDVVRQLGEGLSNKDIGARLFISPRTVQTHLTHIYSKLHLNSRVQVAQEAARRIH